MATVTGKKARNALWHLFFVMGAVSMAWVPRIPEIKQQFGLSDAGLGFVLLGSTCGAIVGSQIAGRLTHSFGSKRVAGTGAIIMSGGLFLIGSAHQILQLFFSLFVMGFGYVALDITVNTQAVAVEKILDKRWMSTFHGTWSMGAFVVTVSGGLASHMISPQAELKSVALLAILLFTPGIYFLLPGDMDGHLGDTGTSGGKLSFLDKTSLPLWAIGLGLLGCLLPEGAASDWGGVLLHEHMGVGKGLDAIAFATFSLAMIAGRFLGDHWLTKFGPRRTVRTGGLYGGAIWGASIAIAVPLSSYNGTGLQKRCRADPRGSSIGSACTSKYHRPRGIFYWSNLNRRGFPDYLPASRALYISNVASLYWVSSAHIECQLALCLIWQVRRPIDLH
jgi:hypothetical protein